MTFFFFLFFICYPFNAHFSDTAFLFIWVEIDFQTDTASVLFEGIQYIKFLQEQVQVIYIINWSLPFKL
jgi:hypothetical protein